MDLEPPGSFESGPLSILFSVRRMVKILENRPNPPDGKFCEGTPKSLDNTDSCSCRERESSRKHHRLDVEMCIGLKKMLIISQQKLYNKLLSLERIMKDNPCGRIVRYTN